MLVTVCQVLRNTIVIYTTLQSFVTFTIMGFGQQDLLRTINLSGIIKVFEELFSSELSSERHYRDLLMSTNNIPDHRWQGNKSPGNMGLVLYKIFFSSHFEHIQDITTSEQSDRVSSSLWWNEVTVHIKHGGWLRYLDTGVSWTNQRSVFLCQPIRGLPGPQKAESDNLGFRRV